MTRVINLGLTHLGSSDSCSAAPGQKQPVDMRYDFSMRVLAIFLVCFFLSGCGDVYRYLSSGSVGWAINEEIRHKKKTEVVISRLTDFSWSELVVFGAYTRQIEVCNRLQLSDVTCQDKISAEPNNDGLQLLVFLRNKEIVHTELHLGWHGSFQVDDTVTLTPQTAVFLVEKKGKLYSGEDNLVLKLRQ